MQNSNTPAPELTPTQSQAAAPTPAQTPLTPPPTPGTGPTVHEHVPGAKNHLVAILLSIFVGTLGVDRFYLGHIGLGVAKLLLSWMTFGIWWLIDVILIATRKVSNVTWED